MNLLLCNHELLKLYHFMMNIFIPYDVHCTCMFSEIQRDISFFVPLLKMYHNVNFIS